MADHALLGPSGASRWLACTPSARLEEPFPDNSGAAASEGTLAHRLGELIIKFRTKQITKAAYSRELAEIEANEQYDAAMFSYCEGYAVFVLEQLSASCMHTKDSMLFLEQKLDLTKFVPDGFGTGDAIIIGGFNLNIVDLKYGKGVPVTAVENKQMMLYALGALEMYGILYDIKTVTMTIYQPRLDSITYYTQTADELLIWALTELRPKAELAFAGEGEFVPGAHCRFCKVRATCRANYNGQMALAKYDFKHEALLSPEEIADVLDRQKSFTDWLTSVKDYALHEAVTNGKKWPGYKLVEGRSDRYYTDPAKIIAKLVDDACYAAATITRPATLLPITELEKFLGKDQFKTYVGEFIGKPKGKPTLAASSDKRPEINSGDAAKIDFAEVLDN